MVDLFQEIRRRRQEIRGALVGAATALLLVAGSAAGWWFYAEWRLGRIELTNEGAPLAVQVLSESGDEPLGEPLDVVRRATLTLPDGDYRLRVSGSGRLSQTYRFAVNRGELQTHPITLDDSRLLFEKRQFRIANERPVPEQPMRFAPTTVALEIKPGAADILEWSRDSLIRRDGTTGKVVWDAQRPEKPFESGRDPAAWIKPFSGSPGEAAIVEPAFDLDGDGLADVVYAFQRTPSLLALSGKDGSLLWNYTADPDGPGGPRSDGPVFAERRPEGRAGVLIGPPAVVDCDRDGTLDLISTVVFFESQRQRRERAAQANPRAGTPGQARRSQRLVVAVSGRSGRWIWSHRLDNELTVHTQDSNKRRATIAGGRGSGAVVILDDSRLIRLDPASGKLLGDAIENRVCSDPRRPARRP